MQQAGREHIGTHKLVSQLHCFRCQQIESYTVHKSNCPKKSRKTVAQFIKIIFIFIFSCLNQWADRWINICILGNSGFVLTPLLPGPRVYHLTHTWYGLIHARSNTSKRITIWHANKVCPMWFTNTSIASITPIWLTDERSLLLFIPNSPNVLLLRIVWNTSEWVSLCKMKVCWSIPLGLVITLSIPAKDSRLESPLWTSRNWCITLGHPTPLFTEQICSLIFFLKGRIVLPI